jgi:hypothetical protein
MDELKNFPEEAQYVQPFIHKATQERSMFPQPLRGLVSMARTAIDRVLSRSGGQRRGGTRTQTLHELKAQLQSDPSSETLSEVLAQLKNFPEEREYVVPIEEQLREGQERVMYGTRHTLIPSLVRQTVSLIGRMISRLSGRGGRRKRSTRRTKTTRRR